MIPLSPYHVSAEAMEQELQIKAADSKNATALREMDARLITLNEKIKQAESMKPANCDCACGEQEKVMADTTTYVPPMKGKKGMKF